MVKTGKSLWSQHPHVDNDLTVGERAADFLKKWFGTWTLLGLVIGSMTGWLMLVNDPGELHLNLALSCMAAVQGIILQIASNRADKKSAEMALALHHINERQLEILEIWYRIQDKLESEQDSSEHDREEC